MASSCLESVAAVPTTATTTKLRHNVSKESEISRLTMKDQKGILAKAEGEWHDEVLQIWTALGCHQHLDLLEVCAPWDSPLGKSVERHGGTVMRLGVHNGFDLSTTKGYQKASEILRNKRKHRVLLTPLFRTATRKQNNKSPT